MSDWPNSLPWLQSAVEAGSASAQLWSTFSDQLVTTLGDLEDGDYVIVNVHTLDPESGDYLRGRYLQFCLERGRTGDRLLHAEASAARFQPPAVRHDSSVARQLAAMGWPLGDHNHQRLFQWPEGIELACEDALTILRDLWQVPHPAVVSWEFATSSGVRTSKTGGAIRGT